MRRMQVELPWHKRRSVGDKVIEGNRPQQLTNRDLDPPAPSSNHETDLETPPVTSSSGPYGVKVLYDCSEATVDICFVHGLTGNQDDTWTAHGQSKPWPETLLPYELNRARILTYGYDAYIIRKSVVSKNGLPDHAMNLLNDLTTDKVRSNAPSRPLIFVAHSLGGLVCKEAILLSRNHPEHHLQGIFNCTKGIAFMGTPHRGSWMARWASIPASALGVVKSTNTSLLKALKTDDTYLQSVQGRFWFMVRETQRAGRDLEVTCFFEELPLPGVGMVVSKDSASLEGYNSIGIHADHRDMVRFPSAEDNGFKRLVGELVRWESHTRASAAGKATKPAEPKAEIQSDAMSSSSFYSYGSGGQFNAPGGPQNFSNGSGNQFPGATFQGPVHF